MRTSTAALGGLLVAFGLACTGGDDAGPPVEPPAVPSAGAAAADAAAPAADLPVDIDYYSTTPYDRAALRDMTLYELALRRNTIYARVGNPFAKKWLDDYFRAQPWYKPAAVADVTRLSEVDRENVARIGEVEASFDKDELVDRLDLLLAKQEVLGRENLPPPDRIEIDLLSAALGEYAGDPSVPLHERNPLEDPNALDRELHDSQLRNLSRRDLRILRNTIFARHGRPFTTESMKSYFAQKAWYAEDPKYSDARLTAVDRENIERIVREENGRGGMLTEAEHELERAAEFAGIFAGA